MKRLISTLACTVALGFSALTAHAVEPVRIGLGIAKTGQFAGPAAGPLAAYQMWIDQINAKGGLDVKGVKRPVELVMYDDQSDTAKTVSIYEKLITDDKVDILLSPWGSHSHFALVGVLERYQFPMVGSTAASMQIRSLKAKNIWFPTSAIPDQQQAALAKFLKTQGVKTVAINTVQVGYPQENRRELLKALKAEGIDVVLDSEYAAGVKDMTATISAVKRANPDAVVNMSYPPDAVLYMKTAREQGLTVPFQFLLVGPTAAFFKPLVGEDNLNNIVTMGHWSPEKADWPGAREFFDTYKERTGEDPDYLDTVLAYVSCQIIEEAVAKSGLDKDAFRQAVASMTFSTIDGPIRFDGVQNVATPSMFLQFQEGKAQIVYPPEVATAAFVPKKGWAQ